MTPESLCPWTQAVRLHPDVEAGDTAVATYAIDLGALVADDPRVPAVYRRPDEFFKATHLTGGLRRLLKDVLGGLAGGTGDRVLQLRSPFGGGKSHTLAALYHAAHDRAALDALPEAAGLPDPGPVRVAVFDGEKFDVGGREMAGQHVRTMWGALAAQLGCYDVVAYHDQNRVAPGGDRIAELLGDTPTLLLLDEVLKYLERTMAERVEDSTLGRQTQDFLESLSVEVARTTNAVLVYSLQASAHEAFGNEALLSMLDHLTSRVDAKREPVAGDEILPVLRRRLLAGPPEATTAQSVAETYAAAISHMRATSAGDEAARRAAEDDRLALRDRIAAAYPFHPALIDIMRERWASLPDFQRTRGALRFLAVCLHVLKRDNRASYLLGPGDIPLDDGDVAQAFFTEVGQREPFKAVLERDFLSANARVKRMDERLAREHPNLSGVRPATRIATAILSYSFGGLLRPDAAGGEPLATGVKEDELLAAVVGPDLDSLTARAVLQELPQQCLFLHYDGVHYVFKTTPNVIQVLEDEISHVRPDEVDQAIRDELEGRLAGRSAILWPRQSQDIPDLEPRFLLAYLPLEFALENSAAQEQEALELLTQYGDRPRRYRNGLGLAVPERNQVDALRRATRYLQAIERVRSKRQQLNLTTAQMQQLAQREQAEKAAFEAAVRRLYETVWLPLADAGAIRLEKTSIAGRPLAATGLHERLIELLVATSRLFDTVTPVKITQLLRLGEKGGLLAAGTAQVVETFYSVIGFPRLAEARVLRQAIAAGVRDGTFGYVGRADRIAVEKLRVGGGCLASPGLARIGVEVPEDSVDLGSAAIVLPQGIEPEVRLEPPEEELPSEVLPETVPQGAAPQTAVRLHLRMTRQQLYACVNALANLAQAAGRIRVTVEAERAEGFDPEWLHNAVLEPLDEADVERMEQQPE